MTTGTLMFYGGMVIATVGFILLVVQLVSMRKKSARLCKTGGLGSSVES